MIDGILRHIESACIGYWSLIKMTIGNALGIEPSAWNLNVLWWITRHEIYFSKSIFKRMTISNVEVTDWSRRHIETNKVSICWASSWRIYGVDDNTRRYFLQRNVCSLIEILYPADTLSINNVIISSKRRFTVVLTWQWLHYYVKCPLGRVTYISVQWYII